MNEQILKKHSLADIDYLFVWFVPPFFIKKLGYYEFAPMYPNFHDVIRKNL